jgi:hypothetical protein
MNIVVRCSCGGVTTYVGNSIKMLNLAAPDSEYVGKDKIRKLAEENAGTPLGSHLQAVAKKSGRYAFYISANEKQEITAMYNLINGKKVY